jgi:hypothetical protein
MWSVCDHIRTIFILSKPASNFNEVRVLLLQWGTCIMPATNRVLGACWLLILLFSQTIIVFKPNTFLHCVHKRPCCQAVPSVGPDPVPSGGPEQPMAGGVSSSSLCVRLKVFNFPAIVHACATPLISSLVTSTGEFYASVAAPPHGSRKIPDGYSVYAVDPQRGCPALLLYSV